MINNISTGLFYLISLYPIFAFIFRQIIDVRPNFFMAIIYLIFSVIIIIKKKRIIFPKYLWFYLLFVVYTIIGDIQNGIFKDPDVITGLYNLPVIIEYFIKNNIISTMLILLIIENSKISSNSMNNITKIIKYIVYIATVVIVIQIFIPEFFLSPREYDIALYRIGDNRRFSIFSWINTSEAGYTYPALISILLSISYMNRSYMKTYILIFMGIVYSFLTQSGYVMLSVLIVISQYMIYKKVRFVSIVKFIFVIVIVLITSYSVLNVMNVPVKQLLEKRVFETDKEGFENTIAYTRVYAFTLFKTFFPENPLFGTGGVMEYDLIKMKGSRTSQIHVGWLSLLYYYGIIGGFFYIAFSYLIIKKLYIVAKKSNYWGSFFVFLTFFISIMGTGVCFHLNFSGFILALVFNKYYEDKINDREQYLGSNYENK
jgi:hypothetical protein